jgi:hypothetical protein
MKLVPEFAAVTNTLTNPLLSSLLIKMQSHESVGLRDWVTVPQSVNSSGQEIDVHKRHK